LPIVVRMFIGLYVVAAISLLGASSASDDLVLGRVYVIEVEQGSRETLDFLVRNHFDVDGMAEGRIRVYAREEELRQIESHGLTYRVVECQPNPPVFDEVSKAVWVYHSYSSLTSALQEYANDYPSICRLYSLGDSVNGRTLWAVKITANPDAEEDEPEFKYVSTIHGDEPIGTEMCLQLIKWLLSNYGAYTEDGVRATQLVDETEIWIVPLMNPDGLTNGTRYNAQGFDLNRNFPSYVQDGPSENLLDGGMIDAPGRPTEVQHMMRWTAQHSFTLSANFHTGALVVNYPFDEGDAPANTYTISPDDALFIQVAEVYSQYNTPMWNNFLFEHGITNGAAWYTVYGGMQDWNYRYASNNQMTIELSNTKKPAQSTLGQFWEYNRESMLSYMETVHWGVRGVVTDASTGAPVYARISVQGIDHPVITDPDVGDYHRMLLPGTYTLAVSAPGYVSRTISGVTVVSGSTTRRDITLTSDGSHPASVHSADINSDHHISLSELLRGIQLYQSYPARSYGYHCDPGSEDDYGLSDGNRWSFPQHSSDYNPADWKIDLSELLRLMQLYNSGGYQACDAGEDGFCIF